jgi:hypothetical protein
MVMKNSVYIADLGLVCYQDENVEKCKESFKRGCNIDTIEYSGKVAAIINHMDQSELTRWRQFVQRQTGLRKRNVDLYGR